MFYIDFQFDLADPQVLQQKRFSVNCLLFTLRVFASLTSENPWNSFQNCSSYQKISKMHWMILKMIRDWFKRNATLKSDLMKMSSENKIQKNSWHLYDNLFAFAGLTPRGTEIFPFSYYANPWLECEKVIKVSKRYNKNIQGKLLP